MDAVAAVDGVVAVVANVVAVVGDVVATTSLAVFALFFVLVIVFVILAGTLFPANERCSEHLSLSVGAVVPAVASVALLVATVLLSTALP